MAIARSSVSHKMYVQQDIRPIKYPAKHKQIQSAFTNRARERCQVVATGNSRKSHPVHGRESLLVFNDFKKFTKYIFAIMRL